MGSNRTEAPTTADRRRAEPGSEPTVYGSLGRVVVPRVARRFPRRFGLVESLALGSAEWLRRHLAIINELEQFRLDVGGRRLEILDFGGAGGSLARALRLYGLEARYHIVTADVEAPDSLEHLGPDAEFVALDPVGSLPMPPGTFDVVVSSDVFEHIPAGARSHWASELGRVARLGQVHSVPADSDDGLWASTEADRAFAAWHRTVAGEEERWTAEHLAIGSPSIKELRSLFPDAEVSAIVSCEVWQATMRARYGRRGLLARLAFAWTYFVRHRPREHLPPYKAALLVIRPKPARR